MLVSIAALTLKMPRSRSRDRRRRSRSRDKERRSRSKDRSRSRDRRRRDRDTSRDRKRHNKRDRSTERHRHREKSADRPVKDRSPERSRKRDSSRDRRRDRSTSRSKKTQPQQQQQQRSASPVKTIVIKATALQTRSQRNQKPETSHTTNDDSTEASDKAFDPRKTFEISNEFSREGFEQFTKDHGIDFSNIETDDDRVAVHEKMEDVLKAHFAAQGKIYPPPKVEKPLVNAATGFANDGSFMEQFKKMQEDYKVQQETEKKKKAAEERLKGLPVRRRFGGKILKTGIVAKTKLNEDGSEAGDAWSLYLKEVQKYKNASCDSDSTTRPLVK